MPPITDHQDSQLYLFARLPVDVRGHVVASNDLGPAPTGRSLVEDRRLHVTLAALRSIGAPEAYLVQLIGWIMATIPPFAFRVAFDELVVSAGSALLKASDPLHGAFACQAQVAGMLRDYGVTLPKRALPVPHATLGYGYREALGVRGIDGISWLVDELVLVRSLHGRTRHVVLGRWQLPLRPDKCGSPGRGETVQRQMELWPGGGSSFPPERMAVQVRHTS